MNDDARLIDRIRSLEQRLLQKGRELFLLKEMSLFLTENVQKTLDLFAYRLNILTNAKFVRVYLLDEASKRLRLVSGYNLSERYLEMVRDRLEVSIDAVPCGRAVIDKVPYIVSDVNIDDAFAMWRDITAMHGYSSYVAMPLIVSERILGVADIFFENVRYFTDDEINLMVVLSHAGALAIENAMLIEKIENISIIDEDTGAFNYKHFMETLRKEAERAKRYNQPLSIIMMQVAAAVPDEGSLLTPHSANNGVMRLFVMDVMSKIRGSDMLFRYNENTFCLILTHTPKRASAEVVISRLYESFHKYFGKEKTLKIGISCSPDDGTDAETIIKKALEVN